MDENKKRNFKFNMTIFFLIVILIITIVIQYCILDYNKNKEQDLKELSEQNKNLTEINKLEENNIDENNYNKENEILENIFSKDVSSDEQKSIADKLINKIYFKDYVEASIYKVGNFTRETIPNDLILRLGFAKAMEKSEKDQKQINTINDSYDIISKSEVEKEIKELFGNDITYKHDKFINIDVETFNGFYPIRDVVRPGDSEYEFAYIEGGGLDCPQIHQEIYDVIESDNKIELKVKVAFIDIADNSEAGNVLLCFGVLLSSFKNLAIKIKGIKLIPPNILLAKLKLKGPTNSIPAFCATKDKPQIRAVINNAKFDKTFLSICYIIVNFIL